MFGFVAVQEAIIVNLRRADHHAGFALRRFG